MLREKIIRIKAEDYFNGRIEIIFTEEGTVEIVSFENEALDNEFLFELVNQGLTVKAVDTQFEYEDDDGLWTCTLWEFAPMGAII